MESRGRLETIIILSVSVMYDQYHDHMLTLATTMSLWRPIVILIKQIGAEVKEGISQLQGGLVNSKAGTGIPSECTIW